MTNADTVSQTSLENGPFHGDQEGYAKVYTALAALSSIAVIGIPWLDILVTAKGHGYSHHQHPIIGAVSANVICLLLCITYTQLYRGLSRKIAIGGQDAVYLDRVRRELATFATGSSVLALLLWWTGVLSLS